MTESTFETMTDCIRFELRNHSTHEVTEYPTHEAGFSALRELVWKGECGRLVVLVGYYVKSIYALSHDGNWLYDYRLVWREYQEG